MDKPKPVAGRPRFFMVPLIDMVYYRCHKRRTDARTAILASALTIDKEHTHVSG